MLEVIRLLDEDVEITDEHVANLESLVTGIADGSVDIESVIESGTLSMDALQPADAEEPAAHLMGNEDGEGETAQLMDGDETPTDISAYVVTPDETKVKALTDAGATFDSADNALTVPYDLANKNDTEL